MTKKVIGIDKKLYEIIKKIAFDEEKTLTQLMNEIINNWLILNEYFDELNQISMGIDSEFIDSDNNVEKKTEIVKTYIKKNTKYELEKAAKKHYTSISKYLNIIINNNIKNDRHLLTNFELKELNKYNFNLVAIGRNLNQITKKLNQNEYDFLDNLTLNFLKDLSNKIDGYNKIISKIILKNESYF
ncbi:MAG: hypothetical protein N4Q32_00105 [Neisseriaceae bacterium]|nr:hypothetical protein [Neisseriaceae bacterium]